MPDLRPGHAGDGLIRVRQQAPAAGPVHLVQGRAGQAGPPPHRACLLCRRGVPRVRLEPPRQVVPAGWLPSGGQGLTLLVDARAWAARHTSTLRAAAIGAATAVALVSRGDVLILAVLLALVALDLAAGAA